VRDVGRFVMASLDSKDKPRRLATKKMAIIAAAVIFLVVLVWEGFEYHVVQRFVEYECNTANVRALNPTLATESVSEPPSSALSVAQGDSTTEESSASPTPPPRAAPLPGTPAVAATWLSHGTPGRFACPAPSPPGKTTAKGAPAPKHPFKVLNLADTEELMLAGEVEASPGPLP
jgi:cytoskeletal protein RodZ